MYQKLLVIVDSHIQEGTSLSDSAFPDIAAHQSYLCSNRRYDWIRNLYTRKTQLEKPNTLNKPASLWCPGAGSGNSEILVFYRMTVLFTCDYNIG